MLPLVHQSWSAVVSGLRHPMRAVIFASIEILVLLVSCSGGRFVAERIKSEGWPTHLRTLVQHGPRPFGERMRETPGSVHLFDADADAVSHAGIHTHSPGSAGGGRGQMMTLLVEDNSPAAALSVRMRIFDTLASLARTPAGAAALRGAAPDIMSTLTAAGQDSGGTQTPNGPPAIRGHGASSALLHDRHRLSSPGAVQRCEAARLDLLRALEAQAAASNAPGALVPQC